MLERVEDLYYSEGKLVMGIDEAGRGPICGPLVVSCCVFPIGKEIEGIDDSKKLSERKRELLYTEIIKEASYYQIEVVSPADIDEYNIYGATKLAMTKLAKTYPVDIVLTDAMPLDIDREVVSLIKGDSRSINIAAASILAKVTRDHIMAGYDRMYPEYGLVSHKGYYTKKHKEALAKYGPKPFYRFSFAPANSKKA